MDKVHNVLSVLENMIFGSAKPLEVITVHLEKTETLAINGAERCIRRRQKRGHLRSLGSLSNGDIDGNENGKEAISLD